MELVPDDWPRERDSLVKQGRDIGMQMRKERGSMRRTIVSVMAIASLVLMLHLISAEEKQPDASLTWHTASIADGVGYSWGAGVLTFQGKAYPFRIEEISVGDMGISRVEATGNVYHLTTIEDFGGHYAAASTSAAIAEGSGVATMRNQHGVAIDLTGIDQGVKLKFAVEGVKITVEDPQTARTGN
jgi:outer membrane immunogenic protein